MSMLAWVQFALLIAMAVVSAVYFCWTLRRYIILQKFFLTDEEIIPFEKVSFWVRIVFAVLAIAFTAVSWTSVGWFGRVFLCLFTIGFYAEGIHLIQGVVIIVVVIGYGLMKGFISLCKDFCNVYLLIRKLFVYKRDKE